MLFTLAWPESDSPLNEFAQSTTKLQFFQKYCLRCSGGAMPMGLCYHPSPGIHPTGWEPPAWNRLLCEQQKLLEGLFSYVNAHGIHICVSLMAVLLFTAIGIACLVGFCYYSLRVVSSVYPCFRPIKKTLVSYFFIQLVSFFEHLFPKCPPLVLH